MPASSQYLKYLTPEYKNIFYSVLDKVDGTVHLLDLVEDSSLTTALISMMDHPRFRCKGNWSDDFFHTQ